MEHVHCFLRSSPHHPSAQMFFPSVIGGADGRPQDIFAARLREKIVNVERNLGKAWLLQVAINGYEPLKPSTITNLVGCASTLGTLVLLSLAMKMYYYGIIRGMLWDIHQ